MTLGTIQDWSSFKLDVFSSECAMPPFPSPVMIAFEASFPTVCERDCFSPQTPEDLFARERLARQSALAGSTPARDLAVTKTTERLRKKQALIQSRLGLAKKKLTLLQAQRGHNPGAVAKIQNEIARLSKAIKPALDINKLMQDAFAIVDRAQTDEAKKAALEALRNGLGLTRGEMRKLVTKPLKTIFIESADRVREAVEPSRYEAYARVDRASQAYGTSSPQTLAARSDLVALDTRFMSESMRLSQIGRFLGKLYPKPKHRSFWSKVKGGLSKVGSGFKKATGFVSRALSVGASLLTRVATGMAKTASAITGLPNPMTWLASMWGK